MRSVSLLAAVAALFLAAPALAQTPDEDEYEFDRECMDEYGRDLCDPKVWGKIVQSFGLEAAEVVHEKGERGIRVFIIDGFSRDMPMVSVLGQGKDKYGSLAQPVLEVRGGRTMREFYINDIAVLRRGAWTDLAWSAGRLQEAAETSPVNVSPAEPAIPPPTDEDDVVVVSVCRHAWVTVVESLTDSGVLRRIRNACNPDAVYEQGIAFAGYALRGFPHCNHIDPATQRNEHTQLQSCLRLEGDHRIAAAEVFNLLEGDNMRELRDIVLYVTPDTRLVWPGHPDAIGPAEITAALANPFFHASFWLRRLEGRQDSVLVSVMLRRRTDEGVEVAPIEQTWALRNKEWRLLRMNVGEFAKVE